MSQRDYEVQPEAPDLADVLQEDPGETLVGPPDSDPLEAGYVPPDRPYLTGEDQLRDEDHDRRLARERPDVADDPGGVADRELDRAPRLAAAESAGDPRHTEPLVATGVGVAGGGASAEEAAMHLEDEEQYTDEDGDLAGGADSDDR